MKQRLNKKKQLFLKRNTRKPRPNEFGAVKQLRSFWKPEDLKKGLAVQTGLEQISGPLSCDPASGSLET